ncbi:MAG: SDR family oxidoreductase, partial [bacterium]
MRLKVVRSHHSFAVIVRINHIFCTCSEYISAPKDKGDRCSRCGDKPLQPRVNAVAGPVETGMTRSLMELGRLQKQAEALPLGRVAQPEEVASVVLFL